MALLLRDIQELHLCPFTQSDITNSMLSQLSAPGAYSKLEKKLPKPFFLNILDHYLPKQQINDSKIFILLEEALEKNIGYSNPITTHQR